MRFYAQCCLASQNILKYNNDCNLFVCSFPVWLYSCIAVVIISLAGLLGVAVIPIMQKVFYNHMLQFLVALAVGALSGDALMHLLPHVSMLSCIDCPVKYSVMH